MSAYSMYIDYVHMYKYIVIIMKLASEQHLISVLINGCGLIQMASYRKLLAVVTERRGNVAIMEHLSSKCNIFACRCFYHTQFDLKNISTP